MLGRTFRCSACPFEFGTGWSHHDGGQFVLCRNCLAYFVAQSARTPWHAEDGETLELARLLEEEPWRSPTGTTVIYRTAGCNHDGIFLGLSSSLATIPCPACKHASSLVETLLVGDACPQCKTGEIRDDGICIY
jgi:hypothetical protein